MFTAVAPLKFGMCGGHISALELWFACKRTYAHTCTNVHTHAHTHTHVVGCFRDYRDWRIPIWLINGKTNFFCVLYYIVTNKTFDSVVTSL